MPTYSTYATSEVHADLLDLFSIGGTKYIEFPWKLKIMDFVAFQVWFWAESQYANCGKIKGQKYKPFLNLSRKYISC